MMRRKRRLPAAAVVVAALAAAPAAQADHFVKEPTATGTGGAAASVDALATRAAIAELRRGGNAIDAAAAAAGVLGVTEPFSSGIGGGGFMVIRTRSGKITTIDGRETAPAAMRPDSFLLGPGRTALPFDNAYDTARWTGLSVGVPGTVATLNTALRRYGTISLRKALRPGARVARRGFTVDQTFFNQTDAVKDWFDDVPSTAKIYLDADGTPRDVGTTLRNPDMARAYRYIGRHGARGFYEGAIARAIAQAAEHPPIAPTANHAWRPGLITTRDIARYNAIQRDPTHVKYRGLDVWSMGPPSSGGSTVGEALNILKGFRPLGSDRTQALHRYLEASRYAYADRNAYLADPAYYTVPLTTLLSDDYAAQRRANIGPKAANAVVAPGGADEQKGTSTTHLSVTDRWGNVVAYTFTIESTGGDGIVVPGWGFLLNNELTDFNFDSETHPNRAQGGKRPRSSISPTIVTRDGRPFLTVGSPGGSTIITTVLQLLVDRLDLGYTLPGAIAAPRVSQRNAISSEAEPEFIASDEGKRLVSEYGHNPFTVVKGNEIGAATGIEFLRDGRLLAAAEPKRRGGGSAAVVRER
jgi:gamma-glutamyltranspeptidase/glutathione hydrolase